MKPQICALLGSPSPEGNTALLLKRAVAGAEDAGCTVRTVDVPSLVFHACHEIYYCRTHPACCMNDDIARLYPLIGNMDSLVIATPVMTMGIPGDLKSFMDRFQVFYFAKYERKSPLVSLKKRSYRQALLISIAGMNLPDNFAGVRASTAAFCDIIDCRLADELYVRDMDNKKDLHAFPEILDEAYRKGRDLGEHAVHAVRRKAS
jgi:multimeric flavodoxin WrbA